MGESSQNPSKAKEKGYKKQTYLCKETEIINEAI